MKIQLFESSIKSFSSFLLEQEEVIKSKRQGITHLQQMKPEEFILWMRTVKSELKGVLKNIKCVSKIDGMAARFGKDLNGNVFFENSGSGPVFNGGEFVAFARSRDDVAMMVRAEHYENILEILKKSEFIKEVPNGSKIICEIFYNPMAFQETETGLKMITITYDKKKLGSLITIMPYTIINASTGQDLPNKDDVLNALYKKSTDKIKIIDPNLNFTEIDVKSFADAASAFSDESLAIIKSRKAADKIAKQNLLNALQKIKDDLADYLLAHPGIEGKFKLGPEIEGIVLHLPDREMGTKPYKITTQAFKTDHANQKLQSKQE